MCGFVRNPGLVQTKVGRTNHVGQERFNWKCLSLEVILTIVLVGWPEVFLTRTTGPPASQRANLFFWSDLSL